MQELNIDKRLNKIEENLSAIKQLLERLLNNQKTNSLVDDDCEIMTVKELAQFLNLDPNIIYAKCGKGDMPYFKIGKGYRFKKSEIVKWVQEQKEVPEISVDDFVNQYLQNHQLKA